MFNFNSLEATPGLIRWVGGKAKLIDKLMSYIPRQEFDCYVEPFVGAGSLYFALKPERAIINDNNLELINTYEVIRNQKDELKLQLSQWSFDKDLYLEIRHWDREPDFLQKYTKVQRAARFIYILKCCFNGLYRVNSKNYFNTPFGRYPSKQPPLICDAKRIDKHSEYLNEHITQIFCCDYMDLLPFIPEKSFVYIDPPYAPLSHTSSFTRYGQKDEWAGNDGQERLLKFCEELNKRNILFLQSNSTAPIIFNLYRNFNINVIDSVRSVSAKASVRGNLKEVVITNYKI